jgi:hypothetical protein
VIASVNLFEYRIDGLLTSGLVKPTKSILDA